MNRRFGVTYRLHLQIRRIIRARNRRESRWFLLVNEQASCACCLLAECLAYCSALKMESVCSTETSVVLCRRTRPHIPEVVLVFIVSSVRTLNSTCAADCLWLQFHLLSFSEHALISVRAAARQP
jgi:hypothetical protein